MENGLQKKIVYDYLSRRDVVADAAISMLEDTYKIAYPTPEKSFLEMCKELSEKQGTEEYDKLYRAGWPYNFFYVPQDVLKTLWDNRKEAYGIEDHWHDDMEFLINHCFKERGIKEVYGPTEWSKEPLRHCEDQVLLPELIGEEAASKVKEYLEDFKNTYKFGRNDVLQVGSYFMSTPNCNRESVISHWKETFGKDIEIPDDSTWVDVYYEEEEEEDE